MKLLLTGIAFTTLLMGQQALAKNSYLYNDSHYHLTNYVQKGPTAKAFLKTMGDKIGRSTLFGIPLQQTWAYENTGDFAPGYYLESDAPLYYYSFTDAYIAMQYKGLSKNQQRRFDPMITGFNPADMYATDHIRRVLETFPGVFSGIGEFTIHKEFVAAKVAGNNATLTTPALDKIFGFAAETGLVVLLHNDIDMPFAKGKEPVYLKQTVELFKRHPKTTIIWAHMGGLGRVVHPVAVDAGIDGETRGLKQLEIAAKMLDDPELSHIYFDISWDEVAKYAVVNDKTEKAMADFLNKYADRILFGSDNVAMTDQKTHLKQFEMWQPVFGRLTDEAKEKILKTNYVKVYDKGAKAVRAWEKANVK